MDLIHHIRHLLFGNSLLFNRKRRAVDEFDNPSTHKMRRISTSQMSSPEDDWLSIASNNSLKRRSGVLPKKVTQRPSWMKDINPIVIDDDDDDVTEVKKPVDFDFRRRFSLKNTSTPSYVAASKATQNGDDDVTFVKFTPPDERKATAKKPSFDYSKPSLFRFQNGTSGLSLNNRVTSGGAKKKDGIFLFSGKDTKAKFALPPKKLPSPISAADFSFRLDEKRKYKELLNKAAPTAAAKSLIDSFAGYSAHVGKFFLPFAPGSSRSKKLVDMALRPNNKKAAECIDLTNDKEKTTNGFADISSTNKGKPRRSTTSEKIKKILSEMDEVAVKDSDSEVEILPSPPSPKSDFAVEKCNSLKTYVHPSEPTHDSWFSIEIKKHGEVVERTQKLIEEQKLTVQNLNTINDELRIKLLRERVSECLHIKDLLISEEVKKTAIFPELTPKQEATISRALDSRKSVSEILSSKFNMQISRQDMLTLSGLNWLNDEVINFYMNLIIERGKMDKWPKAHAMNTFFYPKIVKLGQSSVKRWTRKIDIFSYDLMAVPIHLGVHWCMAIIDFRKKSITYFDSMGSSNRECLKSLLQYLEDEHLDKKKSAFDVTDWRLINARDIPQQMNGSDCGMFSCSFAEVLTRDGEINFSQEHMPYLRRKMVLEILEGRLLIS